MSRRPTTNVVKEAGRVWNITPPPEDKTGSADHHHASDDNARGFFARCLLEARDEVDGVRRDMHEQVDGVRRDLRDLQLDRHRPEDDDEATPFSSTSSIEARLQDMEEKTQGIEMIQDKQGEYQEELKEILGNMRDQLTEQISALDDKIGYVGLEGEELGVKMDKELAELHLEGEELGVKMDKELAELHLELALIKNTTEIQRNSSATRFYSIVRPLCIATGNGRDVQQGVAGKPVGWYWKFHKPEKIDRLILLHEFYQIDPNEWYNAGSFDSDDDSIDLNQPLPQISSIRVAVEKKQKEAVMALFSHLGLRYHIFEDQIRGPTTPLMERKRVKEEGEDEIQHRASKQRYIGKDGVSFSGSPTDYVASSTQSASSRDSE